MKHENNWKNVLVIVVGMLVLYWIFKRDIFFYIGISVGVISLVFPKVGEGIVWGWLKIGRILGRINTTILISLVFVLMVVPLGFLFRQFKKNPMFLKNKTDSLFQKRNHTFSKKDLENVW